MMEETEFSCSGNLYQSINIPTLNQLSKYIVCRVIEKLDPFTEKPTAFPVRERRKRSGTCR